MDDAASLNPNYSKSHSKAGRPVLTLFTGESNPFKNVDQGGGVTSHYYKSYDDVVLQKELKEQFPVGDDYMLIKKIGSGSYGTVVRAKHLPSDTNVAIKKVDNVFANAGDAKRLLREVQILKSMGHHRNVI